MADSPPAWMGWFKGNSRLESMAFLTTTVGCFCVVGGWVTRSKQTQYSLLSTGIIIIPFLKKESKHIWNQQPVVFTIFRVISVLYNDSFWMIPNAGSSLYTSPIWLVHPRFLMDEPVLGTTGLQALAHDPLGGENLRKMGIETAITIIAITCYNCIVLSSYLLIFCSY